MNLLKFCPCCYVVYFGAAVCESCSRTYLAKQIFLVPVPLEKMDVNSPRTEAPKTVPSSDQST